jgi:hypothetical protein
MHPDFSFAVSRQHGAPPEKYESYVGSSQPGAWTHYRFTVGRDEGSPVTFSAPLSRCLIVNDSECSGIPRVVVALWIGPAARVIFHRCST